MGIENIIISRENNMAKALATVKFSLMSKNFILDELDMRVLLNQFGQNTMCKVIAQLKPVEIEGGMKLKFPKAFAWHSKFISSS